MNVIAERKVWTGDFLLGGAEPDGGPRCWQETVYVIESNGRKYIKTSCAMMDAYHGDSRDLDNLRGYYNSEADCRASLEYSYPHWRIAAPLMEELFAVTRRGSHQYIPLADKLGVSIYAIHEMARGARKFRVKDIKAAVKRLSESKR